MAHTPHPLRPLRWIGSAYKDFRTLPDDIQTEFGFQLHLAQSGQRPPSAKLLKGLGSGTIELVEDFGGDTYRAVYTVHFATVVYVLHAFKKKSKQGIKTPQADINLIKRRLRDAEADHANNLREGKL
jgi:phage-related protein